MDGTPTDANDTQGASSNDAQGASSNDAQGATPDEVDRHLTALERIAAALEHIAHGGKTPGASAQ